MHHLKFPNEDSVYREARNKLLDAEIELRRQIENVAAQRRALPQGGVVAEDYTFESNNGMVKLSELFRPSNDTLLVYSYMYGPTMKHPCPGCTHLLDAWDGAYYHVKQRVPLVCIAQSPIDRILAFASQRGWKNLTLLSTAGNTYARDYFGYSTGLTPEIREQARFKDGVEWDMPMLNVFRKTGDEIRHFWGSEMLYAPEDEGQNHRNLDMIDPVWNFFDYTPAGRGDFEAQLTYLP